MPTVSALLAVFLAQTLMPRESITLSDGWKFYRGEAALTTSTRDWENISVPHTWNAGDRQNSQDNYRGPAWYIRRLDIPQAWSGRRVFIRFEAASLVTDVYLNGLHLGQHRGGFAAFCYELTPALHFDGPNEIRVRVDNSEFEDVMPLSGDFTVCGGLYRPVHLIATAPICITPLDYATSGVYVTIRKLERDKAEIECEVKVSNGSP